jgi:hypothetical protein
MEIQGTFRFVNKKVIIFLRDRVCETPEELMSSDLFAEVVTRFVDDLKRRQSPLLQIFGKHINEIGHADIQALLRVFQVIGKMTYEAVPKLIEDGDRFIANPSLLQVFVEHLYNYWRQFERFIVCDSTGDRLDQRPY